MGRKKATANLSVADLERLLAGQKSKLTKLNHRRSQLQGQLAKVDQQITGVEGAAATAAPKPRPRRRGRRPKNTKPLGAVLADVLGASKGGLSLSDMVRKVLDGGFKTKSKNFSNVVYQTANRIDSIVYDKKAKAYRLKG